MMLPDRVRRPARAPACLWLAALLLGYAGVLPAADEGRIDDVRMQVVGNPDADERDYVDRIELPGASAPAARAAGGGTARKNEAGKGARESGREFGRETASEARELGSDARGPDGDRPGRRQGQRP